MGNDMGPLGLNHCGLKSVWEQQNKHLYKPKPIDLCNL